LAVKQSREWDHHCRGEELATGYLPDTAKAEGFDGQIVQGPKMLAAGVGTTGPLARSLFFLGPCEEQALAQQFGDEQFQARVQRLMDAEQQTLAKRFPARATA
jgi:hypothetical protein